MNFFKKRKLRRELDEMSRRGVFYFKIGDTVVKTDPLVAYVKLKEIGFDVMYDDLEGALSGNDAKLKNFAKCVCDAFNAQPLDLETGAGLTMLDCIDLFAKYTEYLSGLKKNVTLLHGFAPDLQRFLDLLSDGIYDDFDSIGEDSLSDSTSIQPTPLPTQDSSLGTEQAEPSTE